MGHPLLIFLIMRILLGNGVLGKEKEKSIEIVGPGDITGEITDAIVNAANSSLLGGGGVDGAIHRGGGPAILAECRKIVSKIGRLDAGKAVITTGGKLAAKYVIHTVGPVFRGGKGGEPEALVSCHRESIRLADEYRLKSVAFPAISTGAYCYPAHMAAPIAISSVMEALASTQYVVKCRFVLFDVSTVHKFKRAAEEMQILGTDFTIQH